MRPLRTAALADARRRRSGKSSPLVLGCGVLLVLVALCCGCAGLIYGGGVGYIRTQPVYQQALLAAKSSPQVVDALGEPIHDGWLLSGDVDASAGATTTRFAVPIEGPKGSGTLTVDARQDGSTWLFEGLAVVIDADGSYLDLRAGAADGAVDVPLTVGEQAVVDGLAAQEAGDLSGAIAAYSRALAVDETDDNARFHRGVAYRARGDLGPAREDLEAATTLSPRRAASWEELGLVYYDQGDPTSGVSAFTRALELEGERGVSWLGRARCYESLDQKAQARAGAQQACELGEPEGCRMAARLR